MNVWNSSPRLTPDLIKRHDRPGPRYTSYPTADRFHDGVGPDAYVKALRRANKDSSSPLSLYVHLPFCRSLCTYCGCSVYITKNEDKKSWYLDALFREMDLVAAELPDRRHVAQLHLGGGTPNYYSQEQLGLLLNQLSRRFPWVPGAEIAIEIDPRQSTAEDVVGLRALGFNRLSMGVQDFDPKVQETIRRVQSFERTRDLVNAARASGFGSVNLDLIYGLPHQTSHTFRHTIDRVLELRPGRIALYSFAYVPWLRKQQRAIDPQWLPSPDEKLAIFCDAREAFLDAGYVPIGMDHFALPDDELALALAGGRLHRNFQGYTAMDAMDVIAFGATGIGDVGGAYVQNAKDLPSYYERIDAGQLATVRGWERDADDEARRFIIQELMCNLELRWDDVRHEFSLGHEDFTTELSELVPLVHEGLVSLDDEGMSVTPLGEYFLRVLAMPFDRHLRERPRSGPAYSRTV